jgi:hypothetical protein
MGLRLFLPTCGHRPRYPKTPLARCLSVESQWNCKERNKSPYAIAKELGITPSAVRNWVMQAEVDQGKGGAGLLTTAEREELRMLRKENRVLR